MQGDQSMKSTIKKILLSTLTLGVQLSFAAPNVIGDYLDQSYLQEGACMIAIVKTNGSQSLCTGSLITSDVLLTAKHCTPPDASFYMVKCPGKDKSLDTSDYILAEKAYPVKTAHDVSLLKLNKKPAAETIALPSRWDFADIKSSKYFQGRTCVHQGYGVNNFNKSGTLYAVKAEVVRSEKMTNYAFRLRNEINSYAYDFSDFYIALISSKKLEGTEDLVNSLYNLSQDPQNPVLQKDFSDAVNALDPKLLAKVQETVSLFIKSLLEPKAKKLLVLTSGFEIKTQIKIDKKQNSPILPGDSGGPLLCEDPTTGDWIQVGVHSYISGVKKIVKDIKQKDGSMKKEIVRRAQKALSENLTYEVMDEVVTGIEKLGGDLKELKQY
jgi:hypothetical protein